MFCTKCGSTIEDNSHFCIHCGYQFQETDNINYNNTMNVVQKKKKTGLFITLGIVTILLIVSVIVAISISNNKKIKKPEKHIDNNPNNNSYNNDNYYDDSYIVNNYDDSYNDDDYYDDSYNDDYYYDDSYNNTYTQSNDFFKIYGVTFNNTYYDLINFIEQNDYEHEYDENSRILIYCEEDPKNQVIDNILDSAADGFSIEHEYGIDDFNNFCEGYSAESDDGFFGSLLNGGLSVITGIFSEKAENAVDGAIDGMLIDNNIYYSFVFDENNQVIGYMITQLYKNRENLYDDFVEKFGQPDISDSFFTWHGHVANTPATFNLTYGYNENGLPIWYLIVEKTI